MFYEPLERWGLKCGFRCGVVLKSSRTPSIVPRDDDQTTYLLVDDLGRHGLVWRETEAQTIDLEATTTDP
jgi:hypothetical protein